MKRIVLALAILAALPVAVSAQSKAAADAKKAVEKSEAAANDAKKAAKAATWLKLGQAYMDAYNAPTATVVGSSKQELALIMGNEKAQTIENVVVKGVPMEKQVFADKNLYFDNSGALAITEVTHPVFKYDMLEKALAAYKKALEIDPVKSKKDAEAGIENIAVAYFQDGFTAYQLGDSKTASKYFGLAADAAASGTAPRVDTTAIYYAGVTALEVEDYAAAKKFFDQARHLGYEGEDGAIYANLSTVAMAQKDTIAAKTYLEQGFTKYPGSGAIMTNLINLYLSTNENPAKIIVLLDEAKKQMPDNASLYYVEGNILGQLKRYDEAVEAYHQATAINPDYEMGYFGEGVLHYTRALEIQEEAEALPYNEYQKYETLQGQIADQLKAAIGPFETAFNQTPNEDVKKVCADYLKRIYFIFRNESSDYQKNYDKYTNYLAD